MSVMFILWDSRETVEQDEYKLIITSQANKGKPWSTLPHISKSFKTLITDEQLNIAALILNNLYVLKNSLQF